MQQHTPHASGRAQPARGITWTFQSDARFTQLASEGASIRALALAFGVGRQAARQHALKLGISNVGLPKIYAGAKPRPDQHPVDLARASLPAGHTLTWGLINLGTCLEGVAYPVPDSGRLRRKDVLSSRVAV